MNMKLTFSDLLKRNKKKLETEKVRVEKEIKTLDASSKFEHVNKRLQESEYESKVEDIEIVEHNKGFREMLTNYLGQIKKAMRNMKRHKYGVCERCGKRISPDRLKADPAAIYCLECATLVEKNETA
jgi:RNA polymerase-binding transcription factor DksA